ncbi:MAG: uroporphyrinogen-III C-methyltransferase [Desulfovibrio sp.]|nr:uroporphyrinogen-III C-methyltransferase [Desulfovibrio sp.]
MKVYLLGAGPGDPGLVTVKTRHIVEIADVVIYDALVNPDLLSFCKPGAEVIYVGKIAGNHALPQPDINALLIQKARQYPVVARLKGGDPYIFGRGGEEAQALLEAGIPFEEVPGISATIAAPAYAGIPLTHRDMVSQVTLITGHERAEKATSSLNFEALASGRGTLVFVMGMHNLPTITQQLMQAGLAPDTPAALIYRGTTVYQRSLVADLATLADKAKEAKFTNPSVIVIGHVVSLAPQLNWFEQKPLFGHTIVVTRAREQASGIKAQLEELGARVLECPTIRIKALTQPAYMDHLRSYQWTVFTSANGVRIFFEALKARHLDARALGTTKVAAIGSATAKTLESFGILPDLVPPRFVAESLVEAFAQLSEERGSVLLPRASNARDVLPKGLQALGYKVDVLPIYETEPDASGCDAVIRGLQEKTISAISFASSQTVTNFLALVPKDLLLSSQVKLAAIGPITAKTLRDAGLPCHIQPETYTIQALIDALTASLHPQTE